MYRLPATRPNLGALAADYRLEVLNLERRSPREPMALQNG